MILKLFIGERLREVFERPDEQLCICTIGSECPLHDLMHEEP